MSQLKATKSNYEFDDETVQMIEKACQYFEHELADEECLEMKLGKIRKKFTDLEVEEKGYYIPIPF